MYWDTTIAIVNQPIPADTTVLVNANELIAKDTIATYQWLDCNDNMAPIL